MVKPVPCHALDKFLARFGTPPSQGPSDNGAVNGGGRSSGGVRLKFWGVRGSIPSPGPETVFYGGNTSCVEVRVGSDIIVLDAGSGLRRLGLALIEEFKEQPMQLNLLITHTHWDHIQGFPFFLPAYNPKNKVTIYGYEGASQGLQNTLSSQMESPYFPISMQEMPGHIAIRELHEMNFKVNQVPVRAKFLNHPGVCTGYRLSTPGGSISYLPDIELYRRLRDRWDTEMNFMPNEARTSSPPEDHDLIEFIRDSDVLIMDSQYDAAEYEKHIGWGHSCVEDSVAFALQADVKRLFLFHHDPDHTDEQISRMVARARQMAVRCHSNLVVEGAREGYELILAPQREAEA
jgi:phosphoribosyl 1,2-cyclic phosphodiesterase